MFPAQRPINAVFEKFGVDAFIDPDGVNNSVKLMPSQKDREGGFGSMSILSASGEYEIRAPDWEGFATGAVVQIGSERRMVQGEPEFTDALRFVVRLNTTEEVI